METFISTAFFDWNASSTIQKFEKDYSVEYAGPGFYLSSTETMLVVPKHDKVTRSNIWLPTEDLDEEVDIYVVAGPFQDTIYSVLATAPVRMDKR